MTSAPVPHQPLHEIPLPDGRILAVAEYGDPAGKPLFFFHGTPGSHLLAGLIAEEAKKNGFRLFAPDRPGLGFSSQHPARTYGSFAEDIAVALDYLKLPQTALIGISGGGPYALGMAAKHSARLSKVVLLSPWWFPHGVADAKHGLNPVIRSFAWLCEHAPAITKLTAKLASKVGKKHPEQVVANMKRHATRDDKKLLADPALSTQLVQDVAMSFRQEWSGQWRETQLCFEKPDIDVAHIQLPIDIFHGMEDNIVPFHYAQKLAASLPHGTLHADAEGGHFVALRLQEEVFALLK